MQALRARGAGGSAKQIDLFGADDTALQEMEAMAKEASRQQRAISEQIAAVQGAAKRPEAARKLGVNVEDPRAILEAVERLKAERERWENWALHPDLVERVRGAETSAGGTPAEAPETGALPKLRSGERQGDLMATQTEDFALAPEKGVDHERRAREAEARAAAAAEGSKGQGGLFADAGEGTKKPEPVRAVTAKELFGWFESNLVGRTFNTPIGLKLTIKPGHFFRLIARGQEGQRKGSIPGYASAEEAMAAVRAGHVGFGDIPGFERARGRALSLVSDIIERPDRIHQNDLGTLYFAKQYEKQGWVLVGFDTKSGTFAPLSFHPKDVQRIKGRVLWTKESGNAAQGPAAAAQTDGQTAGTEKSISSDEQSSGKSKGGQGGGNLASRGAYREDVTGAPAALGERGFGSEGGDGATPTAEAAPAGLGGMEFVHPMEMPEIVRLARELSGSVPELAKLPKARGLFDPTTGSIRLNRDLFRNPEQAAKTLAHEIGHLADWLPDKAMDRGNILGRLATLKNWLTTTFQKAPNGGEVLRPKDRAKLRRKAEQRVGARPPKDEEADLAAWRQEVSRVYRELVEEEIDRRGLAEAHAVWEEASAGALTGLSGFRRVVDNYGVRHALRKHGDAQWETRQGQVAITEADFARVPEIVAKPDRVSYAGKDEIGGDVFRYEKRFKW